MTIDNDNSQRYWQNWDKGEAAKLIDAYWKKSELSWRKMLVEDIKLVLGENLSLLEVGCGSGLIYEQLFKNKIVNSDSYQGGDISNNMLSIARQRFPQVQFSEMDIYNLPLANGSQPLVINIHVIQHLPQYEQAISELMRVTGNKLYIASWFSTKQEDELTFSNPSPDWDGQSFHNNCYSLPRFLSYVITNTDRNIQDIRVHHFGG